MTLKQKIADNYCVLLRSVDPSVDLLGSLRPVPFVEDRIAFIEEHDTDHQKNNALLKTLLEVPDNRHDTVMHGYILALRSNGQDHVANIFHRENDKVIMSGEHHKLLSKKRHNLCEFMNPRDGLLGHLISEEIFSETDSERILSKAGLNEMAKETVSILMRKSDCAFDKFVNALNATNQSHVSYLLTGVGNPPMSDERRNLLYEKMDDIENFIDTENRLLARMISRRLISQHDAEQIRSVTTQSAKARELVEVLRRKSNDTFHQFISSLSESGQSHVAYILTGEGNNKPLKGEHRTRLLSSHREYLVNTIDSKHSGLITSLMVKGVISSFDEQRVTSFRPDTNEDRNEMILNLIARKSQQDFFNFISALNDTGQTHVVVQLIGADVVAKIKTVYESGMNVGRMHGVDAELLQYMQEMFQRNGEVVRKIDRMLRHNGIAVTGVREGCIEVTFTCESVESLHSFRDLCDTGELERMINEGFCSQFAKKGLKSLHVVITNDQFEQCAQTFTRWIPITPKHREALLSSEKSLVNKMEVTGALLDKLSLCKRRREAIDSAVTHEEQVKTLVDIVSRQPDSAFTQLLNALFCTQQTEVADNICGERKEGSSVRKYRELQETSTRDAWKDVDHYLDCLAYSITCRYSHKFQPNAIVYFALRDVAAAVQSLREQYTVPSSSSNIKETIDEELEWLLRARNEGSLTTWSSLYDGLGTFSSFHDLIQWRGIRRLSVRPSVCTLFAHIASTTTKMARLRLN